MLTLDGIINYRKITISKDYEENITDYFHSIFELKDTYPDYNKKIPVNHYRNNEHEKYITILNEHQEIYSNKKTKTKIVSDKKQKNQSSLRQLSLNRFIFQKNRKSNDKDNSNKNDDEDENRLLECSF